MGTVPQSHSTRGRWVLTRPLSSSSVVTSSSPNFLFPEGQPAVLLIYRLEGLLFLFWKQDQLPAHL